LKKPEEDCKIKSIKVTRYQFGFILKDYEWIKSLAKHGKCHKNSCHK